MHCKVHEYMTNIESKCPVCEITDLDILIAEKDATIARLDEQKDALILAARESISNGPCSDQDCCDTAIDCEFSRRALKNLCDDIEKAALNSDAKGE